MQMNNLYNDSNCSAIGNIGTSIETIINKNIQQDIQQEPLFNVSIIDNSTETSSIANLIDDELTRIIDFLNENYKSRLLSLIYSDSFEPGCINNSISFINNLFKYGENAVVQWICQLYQENLNEPRILIGLLNINIYYSTEFHSVGIIMALAAMTNKSQEVKELGVRVLESKCCTEHYNALRSIKCEDKWLMDYIKQVIIDFEEELCH